MEVGSKVIDRIKNVLSELKEKKSVFYFFIADCKNTPNGEFQYIYNFGKTLHDNGFNVKFVYQLEKGYSKEELEKRIKKGKQIDENRVFEGVGKWLGEEYMEIPHVNIATTEWKVGPSDFLFIPEAFSAVMKESFKHKIPCKRIVFVHNFNNISENIPYNDTWGTYGIVDFLTHSNSQAELVKSIFPYTRAKVIPPFIDDVFRSDKKAKKLIVNVVSKNSEDVTRFIKHFYWKYPVYTFLTFTHIANLPKSEVANKMRDNAITVWLDRDASFGYAGLESILANNVVVGRIPENVPDWMLEDGNFIQSGLWSHDTNELVDILSKVVGTWMRNSFSEVYYTKVGEMKNKFTKSEWETNCIDYANSLIENRILDIDRLNKDN